MVKYKNISMGSITLASNSAVAKDVSINIPSGSYVVSIYITSETYYGWFLIGYGSQSTASVLKVGIKNTYTSQLTDKFFCVIGYI